MAVLVLVIAAGAALVARDYRRAPAGGVVPPDGTPVAGGTYVEGDVGMPTTLNPLLATSATEQDVARLLFRGLTRVDGTGAPLPDLASDWKVSDDGRVYTFTLRRDVTWQDGQPVTSQDVRFTIATIQAPDFPGNDALARFWRGIVVAAPDDWTVTFTLLEPFAAFPNYASVPILPRHLLGGVLASDLPTHPFSFAPVGTGPFRLEAFSREKRTVSLVRYDGYAGEKPLLDRVEFRYYDDTQSLLAALKAGEVQGTGTVSIDQLLRPGSLPRNMLIYAPSVSSYTALFFNLRSPLFADPEVRRAIERGIDRKRIVKDVLQEHATVGTGPVPDTSWAYAPPRTPPADADDAKRILEEAGWKDADGDGVREKGGQRLSFPLLVNDDDAQRMAVAANLVAQLRPIGVRVVPQPLSAPEVSQALSRREFAAALFGWHTASGDPDCYQLWHSSGAEDGLNFSGLRNEEIDRLLEEARQATDREQRKGLYAQFQQVFAEQVPAIVLYYPRYYFAVSAGVRGVEPTPLVEPSDRLAQLTTWYVHGSADSTTATP